jgi:hypothetical protein
MGRARIAENSSIPWGQKARFNLPNLRGEPSSAGSRFALKRGTHSWGRSLARGLLAAAIVFFCPGQSCAPGPLDDHQVAGWEPDNPNPSNETAGPSQPGDTANPTQPDDNTNPTQSDDNASLTVVTNVVPDQEVFEGDLVTLQAQPSTSSENLH